MADQNPPSSRSAPSTPGAGIRYLLLVLAAAAVILVDPIANWIAPPPTPDPSSVATPDIELVTKFALALRSLESSNPDGTAPSLTGGLEKSLDQGRKAPADIADRAAQLDEVVAQFRGAIAAAELEGADAALTRLAALDDVSATLNPDVETESEILTDFALARRIYGGGPGTLDTTERERMIERHGLMGRVALTWGAPENDPDRRALVDAAMRTVIGVGVILVVGALGFAIGMALLVVAIVLRSTGRLTTRFHPDRTSDPRTHNAFLETAIVFLGCFAAYKALIALADIMVPNAGPALNIVGFLGPWVVALLVFWPLVRGVARATLFQSMGWSRGRGVAREILAGVAAYLAFLPIVVAGVAMMFLLMSVFGLKPTHPIVEQFSQASPLGVAMLYLMASIWAPLVEESIFRGALFHHARRFRGFLVSALLAAFVFAAIHPQGIAGIPPLMALAVGFAACREWRGSLIGSITAHALHNAVIVTFGILVLG